jgi:cell division protein FtsI/penicillin-binding protein 2
VSVQTSAHRRTQVRRDAPHVKSPGPRRLLLLRAVLALAFCLLGVRLVYIQILDHAHYAKLSIGQVKENIVTTALRGGIYDAPGD